MKMPVTWSDGLGLGVESISKSRQEMLVVCTGLETVEGQKVVSILRFSQQSSKATLIFDSLRLYLLRV